MALDRAVGRLQQLPGMAHALVVLTADHGEAFGEHGHVGHVNHLYEELLRVPLVFCWPGRIPPGDRPGQASVLDVLPTLLGLLGLPAPRAVAGRDLSERLATGTDDAGHGNPGVNPLSARIDHAARDGQLAGGQLAGGLGRIHGIQGVPGQVRRRSVSDGRYKLIWTANGGRTEAYDLHRDPGEREDLLRTGRLPQPVLKHLTTARERILALPRHAASLLVPGEPDADLMRRLSALGYVVP